MAEPVRVTTVPGEPEAEVLCGLLRANGIKCAYRPTDEPDSAFEGFGGEGGARETRVAAGDLEAAKALLEEDGPRRLAAPPPARTGAGSTPGSTRRARRTRPS